MEINNINEQEKVIIDNQTGEIIDNHPKKKENKLGKYILIVLLSAACGFVGGYGAVSLADNNKPVIYQNTTTTNNTSFEKGSMQEVIASVKDSVVEINTETVSENNSSFYSFFNLPSQVITEGAGSGVILTKDGYIITNNHVIDEATTIKVRTTDGTVYDATLVGTDSKTDVAVLKIDANNLTTAILGNSDNLVVGDEVIAIGNPLGSLGGTATNGIISALNREVTIENRSMNLIQTNAAINQGNSGGALFNANGELIGIVNAKSFGTSVEGLGFAIPINDAINIAKQLMESGYVTDRATLGVTISELTQDTQGYRAGVYIVEIQEGSGAQKAGLQPYDRIIAIDNNEVSSFNDLSSALNDYSVGDKVILTIVREGKQMDIEVTLSMPTKPLN